MRRHVLLALFCVGLLFAAVPALGDRGAPVGVAMRDAATDCIKSDGLTGTDGSTEYIDGVEGVTARIHGLGYMSVGLKEIRPISLSRHLWYDFRMMVDTGADGSSSPEHHPMIWQGEILRTDYEATAMVPGGLNGMEVGSTADCAIVFDIHPMYAHEHWWLAFDSSRWPGSSYVTATRVDATTWTIEASTADVAELLGPSRHVDPTYNCGYYSVPFRMVIRTL